MHKFMSFRRAGLIKQQAWRFISLALLLLMALSFRLYHLDFESLWMDEIRQVSYYPHTFDQIILDAASQGQPPLDYWIGHVVNSFSNSDFALRLPSALFGVGAVLFLTLISAKVCSWPVGFVSGIIYALLPFNLYLSQEARPYSIAIFFFLALLWSLDRLLAARDKILLKGMGLFFFLTLFLYSRSLSPLVVTVSLGLILLIWFGILINKEGLSFKGRQACIMLAGFVFGLAFLLFIPSFKIVMKHSGTYVNDLSLMFGVNDFIKGIKHFDIFPIWRAFVVQTEPLTLPFSALLLLSPYFAWQMGLWYKNSLWVISAVLLPVASILNIIIFQAKTSMPFRAPYAIYMLPLVIILAAVPLQGFWNLAGKIKDSLILRVSLMVLLAALIMNTSVAALNFKADRKKSDWKGVSDYLNANFGPEQILIFDSLLPYGRPTFNGFTRYYQRRSPLFSMGQVPFLLSELIGLRHEPVFILFQHREYYLTDQSKYPIHFGQTHIDFGKIGRDPFLQVAQFAGFCIVKLKDNGDTFAGDAFKIISRLCLHLPEDSSLVEMHLAAAGLARIYGLNHWQSHIDRAEMLAGVQYQSRLADIRSAINNLSVRK